MGREIKRVPLDFHWPIDSTWWGYERQCDDDECEGCEKCKTIEPPEGEGYQLWQTVSDAPMSPVFATPEELARHMADLPEGSWDAGIPYEKWLAFINGPGGAPSMMIVGGRVFTGIECAEAMTQADEDRDREMEDR